MNNIEKYPKELFHLISEYAKKRSILSDIDVLDIVKAYTPIYYLIGNHDWVFNKDSKYWKEFLDRYYKGEEIEDIAYDLYIRNMKVSSDKQWYGCFGYKYVEDDNGVGVIKIHFLNDGSSKDGPLALSEVGNRLRELKSMFGDIKELYPNAKYVNGCSWLYNLDSYNRLFPEEYVKSVKSINPKTNLLVIWGQFINSEWGIKQDYADRFLNRLGLVNSVEELDNVFEFKELVTEGKIEEFYKFYNPDCL